MCILLTWRVQNPIRDDKVAAYDANESHDGMQ